MDSDEGRAGMDEGWESSVAGAREDEEEEKGNDEAAVSTSEATFSHSSDLFDPEASDEESAPGLEPSSRPGDYDDINQGESSDGDAATIDLQLPVPPTDQVSAKREPTPDDEELLEIGLAWTDKVMPES